MSGPIAPHHPPATEPHDGNESQSTDPIYLSRLLTDRAVRI